MKVDPPRSGYFASFMVPAYPWNRREAEGALSRFEKEFKLAFLRAPTVVVNDSIAMAHGLFRDVVRKQGFQEIARQQAGGHYSFMVMTRRDMNFMDVLEHWTSIGTKIHALSDAKDEQLYPQTNARKADVELLRQVEPDYVEHVELLGSRLRYNFDSNIKPTDYKDLVLERIRSTKQSKFVEDDIKKLVHRLEKRWENRDPPLTHENLRRDLLEEVDYGEADPVFKWVDVNILLYAWQEHLAAPIGKRLIVGREAEHWREASIPIETKQLDEFPVTLSESPLLHELTWEGVGAIRKHGSLVQTMEELIEARDGGQDIKKPFKEYVRELRNGFDHAAKERLGPKVAWDRTVQVTIVQAVTAALPFLAGQLVQNPVGGIIGFLIAVGLAPVREKFVSLFFDAGAFDTDPFKQLLLHLKNDIFSNS